MGLCARIALLLFSGMVVSACVSLDARSPDSKFVHTPDTKAQ
jgi:hypothetical protein